MKLYIWRHGGRGEMERVRGKGEWVNGDRIRKWRENEEIADSIYGVAKILTYAFWGNNSGSKRIARKPYSWCHPDWLVCQFPHAHWWKLDLKGFQREWSKAERQRHFLPLVFIPPPPLYNCYWWYLSRYYTANGWRFRNSKTVPTCDQCFFHNLLLSEQLRKLLEPIGWTVATLSLWIGLACFL